MADRAHLLLAGHAQLTFGADLGLAEMFLGQALATADKPIMHEFLAMLGHADTLADLQEAAKRIASVLADIKAIPPKVEFPGEED